MSFDFCLRVPVSEEHPTGRFCVEIPTLVRRFPPDPEPDPRRDWSILATIDDLARRLSGDRGIDIVRSVAAQVAATDQGLGDTATRSLRGRG